MSCELHRSRLDDFVDGELESHEADEIRCHLDGCTGCRAEVEALLDLGARVRELPRSIEPSRDLWPRIESRLEQPGRSKTSAAVRPSWSRLLGVAAAAVVCVALVTGYLVSRSQPQNRVAQAGPAVETPVDPVAADAEQDYRLAREQLLTALEARSSTISPHTMAVVTDSVRLLDDTISRISGALEKHPGDSRLNRLLAAAYQQELELLRRATQLPSESS